MGRDEISRLSLDTAYLLDKSLQAEVSGCLMSTSGVANFLKASSLVSKNFNSNY